MSAPDGAGRVATLAELIALGAVAARAGARAARLGAAPGSHAAPTRGPGMAFAASRRYQGGDDVRAIDWRQSARRGRLYTKLFEEEREQALRLLVDLGPSMRFGTRVAFKSVLAARAAAWLAWRALEAGDRVGLTLWDGARHEALPPRGRVGVAQLLRRLAEASAAAPAAPAARWQPALRELGRGRGAIVIISDFAALDAALERHLAALAGRCALTLIHVYDRFEAQPPPGRFRLSDGARAWPVDWRSPGARAAHCAPFEARRARLLALAQRCGCALLPLATDADLAGALAGRLRAGAPAPMPA